MVIMVLCCITTANNIFHNKTLIILHLRFESYMNM